MSIPAPPHNLLSQKNQPPWPVPVAACPSHPTLLRPQGCGDPSGSNQHPRNALLASPLPAEMAKFSKCSAGCCWHLRRVPAAPGEGGSLWEQFQSWHAAAETEPACTTLWWQTQGFADLRPDTPIGKADRVFVKAVHKLWLDRRQTNTVQKEHDGWNGPSRMFSCDFFLERGKKTQIKTNLSTEISRDPEIGCLIKNHQQNPDLFY